MKTLEVVQTIENEITIEVMADSIVAISEGVKKLRQSRLNDRALILLITEATPRVGKGYRAKTVSLRTVQAVLDGLESLERAYIK